MSAPRQLYPEAVAKTGIRLLSGHPLIEKTVRLSFGTARDTNVGFAIWLKKQREARGLSQSDIAKQLGIAYQTYQRIENPAKSNPTLKTILKLERVFEHRLVHVD